MQDIKELTDGSADVMILPETKDDTYLSKLLTTFECGEIVIPKKTAETLSISYFTVPTVAKDYALSVSENLTVDFRYGEVGSVFYIKANGKRILMILKPGTDLSSVPEKWLNADILYSVSDVPKALECDKFGHVILLSDAQRGKKISDLIRADGADVTYTGDREVVLEINSEGLCKIQ